MTPEQRAAATIADPAWTFAADPNRAIGDASTRAASSEEGRGIYGGTPDQRRRSVRYWTEVGLRLCAAAGHEPGEVLGQLALRYCIVIPS